MYVWYLDDDQFRRLPGPLDELIVFVESPLFPYHLLEQHTHKPQNGIFTNQCDLEEVKNAVRRHSMLRISGSHPFERMDKLLYLTVYETG